MTDDQHRFFSKLRQTFKILFIDKKTPHDDTLLEKFTTLLEAKLSVEPDLITESLNAVPWMKILLKNWKTIDSSVAAFGLNVIGISVTSQHCHHLVFKNHVDDLRTCLDGLTQGFTDLPALLRFSTLNLLHKLTLSKTSVNVILGLPIASFNFPFTYLTDDSIFVARAAKDFALCSLVDLLDRVRNSDVKISNESCELTEIVHNLLTCIKTEDTDTKAKRKALVALQLLQEVCLKSPLNMPYLISSTHLKPTLIEIMRNTDDETICSSCSHLLLLLIEFESKNHIQQEWLAVVDILIINRQFTSVVKFATLTGERWSDDKIKIPEIFKSVLLRPLMTLSYWQSTQQVPWMKESEDNWSKAVKILSANNERPLLSKLIGCILSNLPKLHSCFKTSEEKFALLDLLLFILSNFDKSEYYPVKLQNITVDSILGILTKWGSHWFGQLSANDRHKLLNNSVTILDKYTTPPTLMIKIMKIVLLLLNTSQFVLASDWKTTAVKLNEILHKRCNDLQWEIRDSAFEMLSKMAKLAKEQKRLEEWLIEYGTLNMVIIALDDTEGYVRASALQVFKDIPEIVCEEQEIVNVDVVVNVKPIEIIIQILLQDSEGITRRAAVSTLLTCYKEDHIMISYMDHLYKSIMIASMDLDWEVKLTAIDFWDTLLTNVFARATHEEDKLHFLYKTGFFDAAMSLIEDEDVTVQHKMALLIKRLQQSFSSYFSKYQPSNSKPDNSFGNNGFENSELKTTVTEKPDELMEVAISEEQKLLGIENVLEIRDYMTVESVMVSSESPHTSASWLKGEKVNLKELLRKHHRIRIPIEFPQFINWLHKVNMNELLHQTEQTTDLYNINPESLLDDILLDNYESDNEEEIAMDCY